MLPTNIDTKYVKTYTRRPFDDVDELVYVLTWPDGSVTERYTIPNEWNYLASASHQRAMDAGLAKIAATQAKLDAINAQMASEHAEGRIGATEIAA